MKLFPIALAAAAALVITGMFTGSAEARHVERRRAVFVEANTCSAKLAPLRKRHRSLSADIERAKSARNWRVRRIAVRTDAAASKQLVGARRANCGKRARGLRRANGTLADGLRKIERVRSARTHRPARRASATVYTRDHRRTVTTRVKAY